MNRILIVEDDEYQRELYSIEIEEEGYNVDQAANGEEAVQKLRKNKYDLIILDIRMPNMDGIEALDRILSKNKKMPIIIYTAYSNYQSNFITWNVDAFITKTSNLKELKNKIKELVPGVKNCDEICENSNVINTLAVAN